MEQTEISFANGARQDDSIESLIQQVTASGDYRVIRRLKHVERYCEDKEVTKRIGIYLDTEATGMDLSTDAIIEIAMVPFEYDDEGNIYRILPEYNALQDPGFPIPEFITKITHITNEMVKGQAIDWSKVAEMLNEASIVIAHNASFDRPFLENVYAKFADYPWACSMRDINWNEEGYEGVKLEYLAFKHGFFYEGHRATIDCLAGIEILNGILPNSGEKALKRLLDNANRTDVRLWARGAPYDKKDLLRKRGYRWSPGEGGRPKCWYRDLPLEMLDEEMAFLNKEVYPITVKQLPTDRLDAMIRYSNRI